MKRDSGAGRHDLRNVPEPLSGFAADIPHSPHNTLRDLMPVAVVDVYDAPRRVRALARIDLLDQERRHRKISEASYLVGREIERVFAPMTRTSGGGQWLEGDKIDGATQAELAAVLGLDKARAVNHLLAWIVRHVGQMDARLLWLILGHGYSFTKAAAAFGRQSVRGLRYTIDRFREALEVLADAKAARGKAVNTRQRRDAV